MSVVIQVDRLSKQYRLGQIGGKRLVDDVNRWWARLRGQEDPLSKVGSVVRGRSSGGPSPVVRGQSSRSLSDEAIWALRDVSFEVKQGEVLGIIGRNGAGKSTLLKILSRVTGPTSGEVRVKGRIASLLEVGTGFNPELTGRENIFLNGAILGMTKVEIRAKFDEIVDFSGVEQFIDTPVKRYSSGMTVRLAFAVAAHLEPEILIVDEVLAVGDVEFQKKCLGKMDDIATEGRTILFVSHNMQAVRNLCTRCILLSGGAAQQYHSVNECISQYENQRSKTITDCWSRAPEMPKPSLRYEYVFIRVTGNQPELRLVLDIRMRSTGQHRPCFVAVDIADPGGMGLMQAIPTLEPFLRDDTASHSFRVNILLPPLVPNRYLVSLWAGPHITEREDQVNGIVAFEITGSPTPGRVLPHHAANGYIVPHSSLENNLLCELKRS